MAGASHVERLFVRRPAALFLNILQNNKNKKPPPFGLPAVSLLSCAVIVRFALGPVPRAIRRGPIIICNRPGVAVARFRFASPCRDRVGFAGLAGGFYGHYIGILTPILGGLEPDGRAVVMTVIGAWSGLFFWPPPRLAARSW